MIYRSVKLVLLAAFLKDLCIDYGPKEQSSGYDGSLEHLKWKDSRYLELMAWHLRTR